MVTPQEHIPGWKMITCERCGKKEYRHHHARFCLDCARARDKESVQRANHKRRQVTGDSYNLRRNYD